MRPTVFDPYQCIEILQTGWFEMKNIVYIISLLSVLRYTYSQHVQSSNKNSKTCELNKPSMVEHFFNVVFSEFHSIPPVCVCVQMCPDHPMYCYPSGCIRKENNKKDKENIPQLPVKRKIEKSKPIFFMEEKNSFLNDFSGKNIVDDSKSHSTVSPVPKKENKPYTDLLQDTYKILFKVKKMPNMDVKYNLGQQVKNTKSNMVRKDHLDVSNKRWPVKKTSQIYATNPTVNTKFFFSNDDGEMNGSPKFFKRELSSSDATVADSLENQQEWYTSNGTEFDSVEKYEIENNVSSYAELIDSLIKDTHDLQINQANQFPGKTNGTGKSNYVKTKHLFYRAKEQSTVAKDNKTEKIINSANNIETSVRNSYNSKLTDVKNNTGLDMTKYRGGNVNFEILNVTKRPNKMSMILRTYINETDMPKTTTDNVNILLKTTKKSKQIFSKRVYTKNSFRRLLV